ncbi:MAG: cysteine desulfurase [Acutalibacter sp.]|nr:cysteine desulfurase [Acutalibacter sp.]
MAEHYLDNAATTQVLPEAADRARALMVEEFGNPSSLHTRGYKARQELEKARAAVAGKLGVQPGELTFTSGGTEGNNLALFGAAVARGRLGDKIVTTAIEHDSVLKAVGELERQGFRAVYVKPDKTGQVPLEALEAAIDESTILVSVMAVNNETGSILPVQGLSRVIRRKKAPALLHTDGVQAFGKLPFSPAKWGIDLCTVSAHKIHGPKGAGALYVKKGTHILPRSFGGGQERGLRPGTESLPLLGAFGEAASRLPRPQEALPRLQALKEALIEGLSALEQVTVHSPEDGLPYIVNFSAGRVRAETMLHFLAEKGVYVSAGSACGKAKPSHVLEAMGLPAGHVRSALRVSFSRFSSMEDVKALLAALEEGLSRLAKE